MKAVFILSAAICINESMQLFASNGNGGSVQNIAIEFDASEAASTTVNDLVQKILALDATTSGVPKGCQELKVTFGGTHLEPSVLLADAGIGAESQLSFQPITLHRLKVHATFYPYSPPTFDRRQTFDCFIEISETCDDVMFAIKTQLMTEAQLRGLNPYPMDNSGIDVYFRFDGCSSRDSNRRMDLREADGLNCGIKLVELSRIAHEQGEDGFVENGYNNLRMEQAESRDTSKPRNWWVVDVKVSAGCGLWFPANAPLRYYRS